MTEQEQIDKWKDEYFSLLDDPNIFASASEFSGFCMAKRAQKVIEIKAISLFGTDALIAIEKAGYQYTIKGE